MSPYRFRVALAGLLCVGAALAGAACDDLPEIRPDECGNTVVEGWEACDTFGREVSVTGGETLCGQPGTSAACLYLHDDDHGCPKGYGPGVDGVCRRPTWTFAQTPMLQLETTGIDASVEDFDGDGVDDLLVSRPLAPEARLHYFDPGGTLRETLALSTPIALLPSTTGDVSGDGRPEVIIPDFSGLLVMRNTGTNFTPKGYAPLPVETESRPFAIPASAAAFDQAALLDYTGFHVEGLLTEVGDDVEIQFASDPTLNVAVIEGYGLDSIVGITLADLDVETYVGFVPLPNDEIAIGLSGDGAAGDRILVLEPHIDEALRDPRQLAHFGAAGRRLLAGPFALKKSNGATILGHAELGAQGQIFIRTSRLDDQGELVLDAYEYAVFGPEELPANADAIAARTPVAMGVYELGGDLPVVVEPGALTFGVPLCGPMPLTQGCFSVIATNTSFAPWTSALIDVSAGFMVAGSEAATGLDLFRLDGDGTNVNPSRVVTDKPTRQLVAGDFDGDNVTDTLVLGRASEEPGCDDDADLSILWGVPYGHADDLQPLGALPGSFEAVAGRLIRVPDFDGIDDFGVMTTCGDGAARRAGVFIGAASRQLKCAYPLLDSIPSLVSEGSVVTNNGLVPVTAALLEVPEEGSVELPREDVLVLTYWEGALQLRALDTGPDADIVGTRFFPIAPMDEAEAVTAIMSGSLATGDFDADGQLDVVVWAALLGPETAGTRVVTPGFYLGLRRGDGFEFTAHIGSSSTLTVPWLLAPGDEAWTPAYRIFSYADSNVAVFDVDGDSLSDVVGRLSLDEGSAIYSFFQADDGSFTEGALEVPDGVTPFTFFAGTSDAPYLGLGSSQGPLLCESSTCTAALKEAPPTAAVAFGDFDGDGVPDLASLRAYDTVIHRGLSVEELAQQERE